MLALQRMIILLLINLLIVFLINRSVVWHMTESGEKCPSLFPKAQDDVLVLSTSQRCSVHSRRGVREAENMNI